MSLMDLTSSEKINDFLSSTRAWKEHTKALDGTIPSHKETGYDPFR